MTLSPSQIREIISPSSVNKKLELFYIIVYVTNRNGAKLYVKRLAIVEDIFHSRRAIFVCPKYVGCSQLIRNFPFGAAIDVEDILRSENGSSREKEFVASMKIGYFPTADVSRKLAWISNNNKLLLKINVFNERALLFDSPLDAV